MPRAGLSPAALERVRQTVAPDARVVRVRPLRGGLASSVHLVHLAGPGGKRAAVVVRRYGSYSQEHDPSACSREFRLLAELTRLGAPVPRPLVLEPDGGPFGAPTILMERVAGRPQLAPRDIADYVRQLATALLALHRLPLDEFAFLPDQRIYVERALRQELRPHGDPLQERVWTAAQRMWPGVPSQRKTRSILFGLSAADAFLDAYLAAGGFVTNLEFWDLLICTWAVPEIADWASVYPLLGRKDVSPALADERIRAFAARALHATIGG